MNDNNQNLDIITNASKSNGIDLNRMNLCSSNCGNTFVLTNSCKGSNKGVIELTSRTGIVMRLNSIFNCISNLLTTYGYDNLYNFNCELYFIKFTELAKLIEWIIYTIYNKAPEIQVVINSDRIIQLHNTICNAINGNRIVQSKDAILKGKCNQY